MRSSTVFCWCFLACMCANAQDQEAFDWKKGDKFATNTSLALSDDGKLIALGGQTSLVGVWHVYSTETGALLHKGNLKAWPGPCYRLAISPDNKRLAVGGHFKKPSGELHLISLETGKLVRLLDGHRDVISKVAFAPNGQYLISTGRDSTLRKWSVATGSPQMVVRFLSTNEDRNDWKLYQDRQHEKAKVETTHDKKKIRELSSFSISPDSKEIALALSESEVAFISAETGEIVRSLKLRSIKHANEIGFAPSRDLIAVSGYKTVDFDPDQPDAIIEVWNLNSRQLLHTFGPHCMFAGGMSFSRDGQRLISVGGMDDDGVSIWNLKSGKREVNVFRALDVFAIGASFCPDGDRFIAATNKHGPRCFDSVAGKELKLLGTKLKAAP